MALFSRLPQRPSSPLRSLIESAEFDSGIFGLHYLRREHRKKPTFYPGAKRLADAKNHPAAVNAVMAFLKQMRDDRYTLRELDLSHFVFYEGRLFSLYPESRESFSFRILYDFIFELWGDNKPLFERALNAIRLRESVDFNYFLALVEGKGFSDLDLTLLMDCSLLNVEEVFIFEMNRAVGERSQMRREAEEFGLFFRLLPHWFNREGSASGAPRISSPPSQLLLGGARLERPLLLTSSSQDPSH